MRFLKKRTAETLLSPHAIRWRRQSIRGHPGRLVLPERIAPPLSDAAFVSSMRSSSGYRPCNEQVTAETPSLPAAPRQARLPGLPVHNAVLAIAADLAFLALPCSLLRFRPLPCGRRSSLRQLPKYPGRPSRASWGTPPRNHWSARPPEGLLLIFPALAQIAPARRLGRLTR